AVDVSSTAEGVLTTLAHSMTIAGTVGGAGLLGSGEPLLLLAPEHAAIIAREMSRAQAQTFLWEQARLPLAALAPEARERWLAARRAPLPDAVCVADQPRDIQLAVVGGAGQKSTYAPTWGGGTRAVSSAIEL
ncbi:MAG TPA: hypothetical protein VL359_13755, partial [bacterium]|nr:hypothetical protein [bacterium]